MKQNIYEEEILQSPTKKYKLNTETSKIKKKCVIINSSEIN